MVDERVQARVHLFGVLKALELLPEHDSVSRSIAEAAPLCVEFRVPSIGRARLHIGEGQVRLERLSGSEARAGVAEPHVVLACVSPKHFNAVIRGEKQPVPLKGFHRLKAVRATFGALTDRLTCYLRPSDDGKLSPSWQAASTRLTAFVALHALSEIGNHDRMCVALARRVPAGTLQFKVCSDIGVYVEVKDGSLRTVLGEHDDPRCVLWFGDLQTLDDLLKGALNTYRAIGRGEMGMKGFVPMVETMNPLLGRVAAYLGE